MNLQQFIKDAVVTESRLEGPLQVDTERFTALLRTFIASGNLLDVTKKDTFYGLPTDPVKQQARIDRIYTNEDELETATNDLLNTAAQSEYSTLSPLPTVDTRLAHAIIGVSTESVELCEALMESITTNKPIDTVNVLEEFGDICWYIAIAMDALGADWESVLTTIIAKLKERYPDKFDAAAALDRNLQAERQILEAGAADARGAADYLSTGGSDF